MTAESATAQGSAQEDLEVQGHPEKPQLYVLPDRLWDRLLPVPLGSQHQGAAYICALPMLQLRLCCTAAVEVYERPQASVIGRLHRC